MILQDLKRMHIYNNIYIYIKVDVKFKSSRDSVVACSRLLWRCSQGAKHFEVPAQKNHRHMLNHLAVTS